LAAYGITTFCHRYTCQSALLGCTLFLQLLAIFRWINVLLEWSKYWLLSFNVVKCKVVHIGSAPYVDNYFLNETQLELIENIRDLGIQVNSKLKFLACTNTVTKKAYHVLGLSVNLLSVKILMLLLDYIQLLYAPSLNIIIFYGDPLTYLIIKN